MLFLTLKEFQKFKNLFKERLEAIKNLWNCIYSTNIGEKASKEWADTKIEVLLFALYFIFTQVVAWSGLMLLRCRGIRGTSNNAPPPPPPDLPLVVRVVAADAVFSSTDLLHFCNFSIYLLLHIPLKSPYRENLEWLAGMSPSPNFPPRNLKTNSRSEWDHLTI